MYYTSTCTGTGLLVPSIYRRGLKGGPGEIVTKMCKMVCSAGMDVPGRADGGLLGGAGQAEHVPERGRPQVV